MRSLAVLAALPVATAFAPHVALKAVPAAPSMSMKLHGGSKGGPRPSSGKGGFSLSKFLFGKPGKLGGGGGGNGGMIGGGGGNGDGALFAEFDDSDAAPFVMMGVMGALSDVWDNYNQALDANPILTKACTSLVGFSVGDTLAQKFVAKTAGFDYKRLARMAAFGFLFHGTISHFFYKNLDSVLPGKDAVTIIEKVFIDQVLWAPIFTFVYLSWIGITSGLTISQIGEKVKRDLVKGVVGSWTVWPLAHTINFRFVPSEQRLLYINSIQIGYNVFLSVLGSGGKKA